MHRFSISTIRCCLVLSTLTLIGVATTAHSADRPNVVLMMADDKC
jgi:hypothetical protein